jgi:hypothetical protein
MFQKQVIDTENYNTILTNLLDAISVEVNQNYSKVYFYDPSDLLANNVKGKHV